MLARTLFSIARSAVSGPLVRVGFRWFWWLIPVRRLASTSHVLAFRHPRPSWGTHILIVPKRGIAGLTSIGERDLTCLAAIFTTAQEIASGFDNGKVSLVINGGAWQDVGQMHAHLIAGEGALVFDDPAIPQSPGGSVVMHPEPARRFHAVISLSDDGPGIDTIRFLVESIQRLVQEHDLSSGGFAMVADAWTFRNVHLISGPDIRA